MKVKIYKWAETSQKPSQMNLKFQANTLKNTVEALNTPTLLVSDKYQIYAKNFLAPDTVFKTLLDAAKTLPAAEEDHISISAKYIKMIKYI